MVLGCIAQKLAQSSSSAERTTSMKGVWSKAASRNEKGGSGEPPFSFVSGVDQATREKSMPMISGSWSEAAMGPSAFHPASWP